jgi:hypothetical protein
MSALTTDGSISSRRRPMRRRVISEESRPPQAETTTRATTMQISPPSAPGGIDREETASDCREIMERKRLDRRRQIDPTTCERDYSSPEIEFMRAMDDYKRKSGRPFPTWSEVLEVVISLGYRKVADPSLMEWRTFADSSVTM